MNIGHPGEPAGENRDTKNLCNVPSVPVCPLYPRLSTLGKTGLTVTLYLIGTGISKSTLKQVGPRPLLQGILLWAIVAVASLTLIRYGLISI